MILVYLNVVRMGEIPSGSSTKLNPRSTAVAPAVAFVREGEKGSPGCLMGKQKTEMMVV